MDKRALESRAADGERDSTGSGIVTPADSTRHLGKTVLPRPLAHAVSLATRSTCVAIRAGTVVGSYGFDAARFTTLSSLGLGRTIVEGILTRAGKDVVSRSQTGLGRDDAESVLERSLESLHYAMTQVVFWTTVGFQLTGGTISVLSEVSQLLLSSLDQFFGSTDSSRAIASIITLIRREFQNPATGVEGERVGVTDLILGLCALSYLQRSCRRSLEEESKRLGYEDVVWDVVVLNDGERIDIHEDSLYGVHDGRYTATRHHSRHSFGNGGIGTAAVPALEHAASYSSSEDDDLPEIRLKNQIMRSLPADATVSISTSVTTTKTITVDVTGSEPLMLSPPPGVEVVEERALIPAALGNHRLQEPTSLDSSPAYRVVYRVDRNKLRTSTLRRVDEPCTHSVEPEELDFDASADAATPRATSIRSLDNEVPPFQPRISVSTARTKFKSPPPRTDLHPMIDSQQTSFGRKNTAAESFNKTPEMVSSHSKRSGGANEANQKRLRTPLTDKPFKDQSAIPRYQAQLSGKSLPKQPKSDARPAEKRPEKKGGLRNAFRIGSGPSIANLWSKEHTSVATTSVKAKQTGKQPAVALARQKQDGTPIAVNIPILPRTPTSMLSPKDIRCPSDFDVTVPTTRSPSRSSHISIHEQRRDSIISQTDTFSIHSTDGLRPPSPVSIREPRNHARMSKSRSEKNIAEQDSILPVRGHRRVKSHIHTPSLYSMATNDSQRSLILSSYYQRSAYSNIEALNLLRRTGMVEGTFPRFHMLRNITRYIRFSSASYGSNFLKFMGISKEMPILRVLDDTHHDVRSFARHTESQPDSILLASFVDPQGGTDSTGATNTGVPLVHYISLDHESKAVVLACRGTLGFEDVLADMTCDYDTLVWRGKGYKVHKGIHASARRLLYGGDGRVLLTLKETLDEFKDYGLVLTGHSLGGAVTALLGIMLSEPNTSGTDFITSAEPGGRLLTDGGSSDNKYTLVRLPPRRPIHVYAYGPPGTMSPSLCKATRGLITTVVQGNDLVPYLSLGILHDFQAVALAFKNDSGSAKAEIKQRVWQAFQMGLAERWYSNVSQPAMSLDNDWDLSVFKTLRANMIHEKLLPPGEVFVVESTRVLRRDAFLLPGEDHIGRPAKRIVLKYVRDVEARFREVRFGTSMLIDHSPARYEDTLTRLRLGVVETGI